MRYQSFLVLLVSIELQLIFRFVDFHIPFVLVTTVHSKTINSMFYFLQLQEECYEALESISRKINTNDADMRSHVILSMIKVAAAEADVPDLPPSGSPPGPKVTSCLIVFNCVLVTILSKWWYSAVTRTGRTL